jgi:hypothetical protein
MRELTRQIADAADELTPAGPIPLAGRLLAIWPHRLPARACGAAEAFWPAPPQPASSKTAATAKPGSATRTGLVRAGMGQLRSAGRLQDAQVAWRVHPPQETTTRAIATIRITPRGRDSCPAGDVVVGWLCPAQIEQTSPSVVTVDGSLSVGPVRGRQHAVSGRVGGDRWLAQTSPALTVAVATAGTGFLVRLSLGGRHGGARAGRECPCGQGCRGARVLCRCPG